MTTRKELYKKFGPLLMDSIVQIIKDEINILRVKAGLPERTNEQLVNTINTKLDGMELYPWMLD